MSETINVIFGPLFKLFFTPINAGLNLLPVPIGRVCALALFIGAMAWVYSLNKEYVNLDAPRKNLVCDLRLWTVISMLPHVIVYLFL